MESFLKIKNKTKFKFSLFAISANSELEIPMSTFFLEGIVSFCPLLILNLS